MRSSVEETLRNLKQVEEKYKIRFIPTGEVNISEMARDCIDTIEALQQENERLAGETIKLMRENAQNSMRAESLTAEKDELIKVLKQAREAIQRAKENFEPYGEYEYDVRYDLEEALAGIDKVMGGKEE